MGLVYILQLVIFFRVFDIWVCQNFKDILDTILYALEKPSNIIEVFAMYFDDSMQL